MDQPKRPPQGAALSDIRAWDKAQGEAYARRQAVVTPPYPSEARINELADEADEAFWAVVAAAFPGVPGDVDPSFVDERVRTNRSFITAWLENHPDAPGHPFVRLQRLTDPDGWVVDAENTPLFDTSSRWFATEAEAQAFADEVGALIIAPVRRVEDD